MPLFIASRDINLNTFICSSGICESVCFGCRNKYFWNCRIYVLSIRMLRPIPGRNLMAPPKLARDAPRLDVFHPVEIGRFPIFWNEFGLALAHGDDGRLGHLLGVDVPL